MQRDPGMAGQPGTHRRVRVGGVVVDHHVQLAAGVGGGDLLLVALGRAPGRDLHTPPHAVQQQIQAGQGVVHAEPDAHHRGDARQRPALIDPAPRRRTGVEQRGQFLS